jgi:hypothetical protein
MYILRLLELLNWNAVSKYDALVWVSNIIFLASVISRFKKKKKMPSAWNILPGQVYTQLKLKYLYNKTFFCKYYQNLKKQGKTQKQILNIEYIFMLYMLWKNLEVNITCHNFRERVESLPYQGHFMSKQLTE